jgi:5-(carboxyamino)imidazole ribonucleotide synthase
MFQNKKIGILGGGQLGRMLVEASIPLSLDVSILDESLDYPAAGICTSFYEGSFSNYSEVLNFGLAMDIITVEIESVNTDALKSLQAQGKLVFPQPEVLELINDKGLQKLFYQEHLLPSSAFALYDNKQQILEAISNGNLNFPFVQKIRKGGYDGRGVLVVNEEADLELLMEGASLIENKVKIKKEMAVIVARSSSGEIIAYPMVEMEFHPTANLVEYLYCPSELSEKIQLEAERIALMLAEQLGIVGLLAVEFFLNENDEVLINEMAPRPHNSGHHTIEACETSQFEQMLRAILGLPLGPVDLINPAAMINLIGEEGHVGKVYYQGLSEALGFSGVYPHIYNKKTTKPNRKMGHITIVNKDLQVAKSVAMKLRNSVKVITK